MKDYLKINPVYLKALDEIEFSFTSHSFINKLRSHGVTEKEIRNNRNVIRFLIQKCDRLNRSQWQKRDSKTEILVKKEIVLKELSETQMINRLKKRGYIILKGPYL